MIKSGDAFVALFRHFTLHIHMDICCMYRKYICTVLKFLHRVKFQIVESSKFFDPEYHYIVNI